MHELCYTSVPKGIDGRSGFTTVALTRGLPPRLQQFLEGISSYEWQNPDPHAWRSNPVCFSHLTVSFAQQKWHVLSRVGACPPDHSGRNNFFAHHVAFSGQEVADAALGPCAAMRLPGFFFERCPPPQLLQSRAGVSLSKSVTHADSKLAWEATRMHPSWRDVISASPAGAGKQVTYCYMSANWDVIAVLDHVFAAEPVATAWKTTFATYSTPNFPPTGIECLLRCTQPGILNKPTGRVRVLTPSEDPSSPPPSALLAVTRKPSPTTRTARRRSQQVELRGGAQPLRTDNKRLPDRQSLIGQGGDGESDLWGEGPITLGKFYENGPTPSLAMSRSDASSSPLASLMSPFVIVPAAAVFLLALVSAISVIRVPERRGRRTADVPIAQLPAPQTPASNDPSLGEGGALDGQSQGPGVPVASGQSESAQTSSDNKQDDGMHVEKEPPNGWTVAEDVSIDQSIVSNSFPTQLVKIDLSDPKDQPKNLEIIVGDGFSVEQIPPSTTSPTSVAKPNYSWLIAAGKNNIAQIDLSWSDDTTGSCQLELSSHANTLTDPNRLLLRLAEIQMQLRVSGKLHQFPLKSSERARSLKDAAVVLKRSDDIQKADDDVHSFYLAAPFSLIFCPSKDKQMASLKNNINFMDDVAKVVGGSNARLRIGKAPESSKESIEWEYDYHAGMLTAKVFRNYEPLGLIQFLKENPTQEREWKTQENSGIGGDFKTLGLKVRVEKSSDYYDKQSNDGWCRLLLKEDYEYIRSQANLEPEEHDEEVRKEKDEAIEMTRLLEDLVGEAKEKINISESDLRTYLTCPWVLDVGDGFSCDLLGPWQDSD